MLITISVRCVIDIVACRIRWNRCYLQTYICSEREKKPREDLVKSVKSLRVIAVICTRARTNQKSVIYCVIIIMHTKSRKIKWVPNFATSAFGLAVVRSIRSIKTSLIKNENCSKKSTSKFSAPSSSHHDLLPRGSRHSKLRLRYGIEKISRVTHRRAID